MKQKNNEEIRKTWITGKHSCTLILPRCVAKEHGLEEPSHVIVKSTSEGILIKKLVL